MSQAPFTDHAIVLGQIAYGESDRIATLLTRAHGRVSAIARGAQNSRKRFGAALATFVIGEAMLRERRGADLLVLDAFDARRDFSGLATDVVKLAHASYATELVRELVEPRHPDPALFDLVCELYETVSTREPRADTLRAFELRLLDELGLRPVLDRCVACGGDAVIAIDPDRGGGVCRACGRGARARSISDAARARLIALRDAPLAEAAARDPAPAPEQAEARHAVQALLAPHLRGPMRSLEFLEKLRAARAT